MLIVLNATKIRFILSTCHIPRQNLD